MRYRGTFLRSPIREFEGSLSGGEAITSFPDSKAEGNEIA